jgi:hypothetical protein
VKSTKLKLMSATAGAGAVLTMGVVSVAFSETSSAEPAAPDPAVPTAQTSTETTAPPTPTTTFAEPSITGPAPLAPEQEGLPG